RVVYSGDLVDEKSRTVRLLAEAENPERLLKPGMFVDVSVLSPRDAPAVHVPASALLTQADRALVFVKTGPEQFARRAVVADEPRGEAVAVRSGLSPGEEVVVEGASKLKSMAAQVAGLGP